MTTFLISYFNFHPQPHSYFRSLVYKSEGGSSVMYFTLCFLLKARRWSSTRWSPPPGGRTGFVISMPPHTFVERWWVLPCLKNFVKNTTSEACPSERTMKYRYLWRHINDLMITENIFPELLFCIWDNFSDIA